MEDARLTPEHVREIVGEDDGVIEVVSTVDNGADVVIWNRDGSTAEMSGNATRIAARWLVERTGADEVTVRVGDRRVVARALATGEIEQELGRVGVGDPEEVEGIRFRPVSV